MAIKLAYYLPTKPRSVVAVAPKNNFPITEDESHSMIIVARAQGGGRKEGRHTRAKGIIGPERNA